MTTTQVREATLQDLDFIVESNLAMARETEDKGLDPETLRRGVHSALSDGNKGRYLVAESEGQSVGTLMLTLEWSDWRNAHFWWIQSVYVLPSFRGTGVYGSLHREVVAQARSAGNVAGIRLYVEKENEHASQVYAAMGMHLCRYDLMEQALGDSTGH